MKKSYIVLLLFTLVGSLTYAQSFTVDGLDYSVQSGTDVQLTGGTPGITDLVIPETVTFDGTTFTVTSVGNNAFNNVNLTSILFPNSIRTIGVSAFANNELNGLILPDDIVTISDNAFRASELSGTVLLPNSVTTVGDFAFAFNELSGITISENLQVLETGAFRGNALTSVTIPATVTRIQNSVFRDNQLTDVSALGTIPPAISTGGNGDSFGNRNGIDLLIPTGSETAYAAAGWTGFQTINGVADFNVGSDFTVDGFNYRVTSFEPNPNEAELRGSENSIERLVIPENITFNEITFTVTGISSGAFNSVDSDENLTSVTFPATITTIGDDAFTENAITSLELPDGLIFIGKRAFRNNQISGALVLPNTVTSTGLNAFAVNNLSSVTLSESLTRVENGVFAGNSLTSLVIPESVNRIDERSFTDNTLAAVVVLGTTPPSVITGSGDSFGNRDRINLVVPDGSEGAYLADGWTGFRSVNGVFDFSVGFEFTVDDLNYKVTSLESDEVALTGSENPIQTLFIPADVTFGGRTFTVASIENDAFNGSSLTTVEALGTTPPTVVTGTNDSFGNRDRIDLVVPNGSEGAYLSNGWTGFRSVNGVRGVVGETFTDSNLNYEVTSIFPLEVQLTGSENPIQTLVIPDNVTFEGVTYTVTSVGNGSFRLSGLTSVTFPSTITTIIQDAFSGNELGSLDLPDGLVTIGNNAFGENDIPGELVLPNSVTSLGQGAFTNNAFTSVILSENLQNMGDFAFQRNQLTAVIIPTSVMAIGQGAFRLNPLSEVIALGTTPPTVETGNEINDSFGDRRNNINLTVPFNTTQAYQNAGWNGFGSVTELAEGAFTVGGFIYEITSTSPNEVTLIGGNVSGADVIIPESVSNGAEDFTVTEIGQGALSDANIVNLTLPSGIRSIGSGAFGNDRLRTVTVQAIDPPSTNQSSFGNRRNIRVTVPEQSLDAYLNTTSWTRNTEDSGDMFFSINGVYTNTLSRGIVIENIEYRATNRKDIQQNTVEVFRFHPTASSTPTDLTISPLVISEGVRFVPTRIADNAFDGEGLISVDLPSTITEIGIGAFSENEGLRTVSVQALDPPGTNQSSFGNRGNIRVTVPGQALDAYLNTTSWTRNTEDSGDMFFSINGVYTNTLSRGIVIENIEYRATNRKDIQQNTVEVFRFHPTASSTPTDLTISPLVISEGVRFVPTRIADNAFDGEGLTSVELPSTITEIGSNAFSGNPLTLVTSENTIPPAIEDNTFGDRSTIDLVIPEGTAQAYQDAGWTGFGSVAETTDILTFQLLEQTGDAMINTTDHTVEVQVIFGTDVTELTPTFTLLDGATSSPASGSAVDFSNSVTYTVTAEDGTTVQDWTVAVTEAANAATDILTFELAEQTGSATINATDHTVAVEVAFGTDVTGLTPTFTLSEGATSNPASGVAIDFSNSVTYTVTAEDGTTIQEWIVTVTEDGEEPDMDTDILTFELSEQIGAAVINAEAHTMGVEVAFGTDVSGLTPTFTLSEGATSDPASGVAVDFSNPVTYTVTAEDGTTIQNWIVTVTESAAPLSSETDILSFVLTEQTGEAIINTTLHTVEVNVAAGTSLTALRPTLTLSEGATSNPASGVAIDFTDPVTLTVTAEDGATVQDWRVTVTVEGLALAIEESIGLLFHPNPVQDVLHVKTKEVVQLSLTDLNGRIIRSTQEGSLFEMDLSQVEEGVYLLVIRSGQGITTQKIIKDH